MLELGKLDNHFEVSRKMGKTKIGIEEGEEILIKGWVFSIVTKIFNLIINETCQMPIMVRE